MQMAQEAGNGFIRLRLRLIHLHGKSRTPEGPHGKESGHDGLHRSGLRERLLLLGFNLYGDSDWRGGDAGTLAGWYTIPDGRLSSAGLVYAERTVPSGLASLVLAVIPLYVALIEMFLPGGEPLPVRGWLGMALGFAGLGALVAPSLRTGLAGDHTLLLALAVLLAGGFSWTIGSILSRRLKLPVNSFVAAAWQMLAAGAFSTVLGTVLGQWP